MVEKYKITKKEEVYNLLKDKRNFSYMSESLLRRLINEMKVVRFTQKTLLLKQNTENRFIYIIIKGKVTVYVEKKALYTLRRTGDVFGELSFATKSPSTASIVAEEGLGVMALNFNYLKKLNDIEFGFWLCRVLGEKLIRTSNLKAIRTIENIDELETTVPAADNPPKNETATALETPAADGPEMEEVEAAEAVETAEEDIVIEDVLGDDEEGEGDTGGGDVTESPDQAVGDEKAEEQNADTPPAEPETEAAADDDEEGGEEYVGLDFEP